MKKLLVVLGLSAIAMAGKCSSSKEENAQDSATKAQEEFPVKEEAQTPPAEEVPSYEQQAPADAAGTTTTPDSATSTPAPSDTTAPAPTTDTTTTQPTTPSGN